MSICAARAGLKRRQERPARAEPVKKEAVSPRAVDAPTTTSGSNPRIGWVGSKMGRLRRAPSAVRKAIVAGTPPAKRLNHTKRRLYRKKSSQFRSDFDGLTLAVMESNFLLGTGAGVEC